MNYFGRCEIQINTQPLDQNTRLMLIDNLKFKSSKKDEPTANAKVLLVDDEDDILDFLSYNLKKEGYEAYKSHNGKDAIKKALEIKPQLIIMDIMMPEMDGVEACKLLKEYEELENTMIAFLTARSEEYSEIACLEAGADDFIKKPVKPRLFITHVKALLRRHYLFTFESTQNILIVGDLCMDLDRYQVTSGGQEVILTQKEFKLLQLLMSNPTKVFLRNEIFSQVWGYDIIVGERTIDVHISKLREKLNKKYIKTVKKVGYKLI